VISCAEGETVCDVSGIGRVTVKPTAGVGTQAQFILRPEKVRLSREKPLHLEKNCVYGKIEHLIYLGMITEYHLKTDQGFGLVATVLNVNQSTQKFEIGESIWATWSSEDFIRISPIGSDV
jgi:putrescine transport system ATP-binding protein